MKRPSTGLLVVVLVQATGLFHPREPGAQGIISTVVGPTAPAASCAGRSGLSYHFDGPTHAIFDPQGRLVVAEFTGNRVVRVEPDGSVTVLAGTGREGYSGDGGPATAAQLDSPFYLAFDPQGRLCISDSFNGRIRRIEPDGTITTVVGGGTQTADGAPSTDTRIRRAGGLAFDAQGRLCYADMSAPNVRRVESDGTVHTVATGPGDVPKGQQPALLGAGAIALDPAGNLYVTEFNGSRVRMIAPDGTATTLAGSGKRGFAGDGGPALAAQFDNPWGIAWRPDGVYVVDAANQRVRRITPDGRVDTVAGGGSVRSPNDGGDATKASILSPCCIDFDESGNLYVNDIRGSIRKIAFGPLPPGDLDGDGAVTAADVRLLLRFLVGAAAPLPQQSSSADLDGDGRLTVLDAVRLLGRSCAP